MCDLSLLENNLKKLSFVSKQTNIKILLALKGYAYYPSFHLIKKYLHGACASGLYEAKLSNKEISLHTHTHALAYKKDEIKQISKLSTHIVFNSINQLYTYKNSVKSYNKNISIGLRINPQVSFSPTAMYDPCGKYSRFGIKDIDNKTIKKIEGLHFHALCESDSYSLEIVLKNIKQKFKNQLNQVKWLNIGGGHLVTKNGYDVEHLIHIINNFKNSFPHLEMFMEPGEAIGWECGVLVASVLDIVENEKTIAILDTSAEAHMPDVLLMPYRPEVVDSGKQNEKRYNYIFGGNTCLSGDIIGEYSFDNPLKIGDKIIFKDMMHYSIVKNTTFNGIKLPQIAMIDNNKIKVTKKFKYKDYKNRLG